MIANLPQQEQAWLKHFFASPNELTWSSLQDGSAPSREREQVQKWLSLFGSHSTAPLILPFIRSGSVTGWYATTQSASGGYELGDDIYAWLGPTWLSSLERLPENLSDPMATALRDRFGGSVYRFTGADDTAVEMISARLSQFAAVLERMPIVTRRRVRPVGAIRSDFERALLAGDEAQAEAMIAEFKQTGRLNEENLRYLEVRLNAGLGLWPQIARDHWLIKTLVDLALPPQILSDLIEALYRTYIDDLESAGDAAAMRDAFAQHIATPYPKLFASRRGIRAPRVIKAFALYEQLQPDHDPSIIDALLGYLPDGANTALFKVAQAPQQTKLTETTLEQADEAFDDGQFDRAFEFYLRLPASRKTISRLVTCVGAIGTDETREHLLVVVDKADEELVKSLAPAVASRIESLRQVQATCLSPLSNTKSESSGKNPWMRWAEQLQADRDLVGAERNVQSAPTNWDVSEIRDSGLKSQEFADIIGSLNGDAGALARVAVPQIYSSFFPDDRKASPTAKPVASLLFLLIAMDETLSRTDLDLLAQLTSLLIDQGLSAGEYISLINDLEDVQKRIGSYSYLPWSLDVSETLATLPCPSDAARDARLRFFMQVLGQASGFAHRLESVDLLPMEALAKDYGIGTDALTVLKRDAQVEEGNTASRYDLDGKMIGIYTLAESAGSRAKASLEALFPGCKVVVNSDQVATSQLKSLAKAADFFVFAWKSSSHQAFFCVKDALAGREPIWAPGKGTASILRAVLDHLD